MYFDEDGDLAHEFYQEERVTGPSGGVRWRMKQIFDKLIPQVKRGIALGTKAVQNNNLKNKNLFFGIM